MIEKRLISLSLNLSIPSSNLHLPLLRVKLYAQAVAKEIEGDDGQHNRDAGAEGDIGERRRKERPSANMEPQSGSGGWTPSPKKERAAISRMA